MSVVDCICLPPHPCDVSTLFIGSQWDFSQYLQVLSLLFSWVTSVREAYLHPLVNAERVPAFFLDLHLVYSGESCHCFNPKPSFYAYVGDPPIYRFWKNTFKTPDQHTPSPVTAQMVETTAYALLTTLLRGDANYAKPIIKWLSEEQRYGGGFYSTQVSFEIFCSHSSRTKSETP